MKKYEVLVKKAIEELKNNDELFVDMVNELDSWNGYADGFRAYPMCELDDLHYGLSLSDFLNRLTSDFNINDEYFYYSIYGLESTDDIAELYRDNVSEEELFDELIEHYYDIDIKWFNAEFDELIDEIINFDDEDDGE